MYITICKIDSQWNLLYDAGRSNPALCDNLEGWNGVGGDWEVQEGGDTCIPLADLC